MVTWGLISAATAFVTGPTSFFILRFLLGAAEAGFLPGMILYLGYWFPLSMRARYVALFMAAVPIASAIGSPFSALVLQTHGFLGLAGWQWLFIIEGIPASLLGIVVLLQIAEWPHAARWLDAGGAAGHRSRALPPIAPLSDAATHHGALAGAAGSARPRARSRLFRHRRRALRHRPLAAADRARHGLFDRPDRPDPDRALCAERASPCWPGAGTATDRRERMLHVAARGLSRRRRPARQRARASQLLAIAAITFASIGIYSALGPFWAVPPLFLRGTAAAAGIALINSIGNLGGFVGPLSRRLDQGPDRQLYGGVRNAGGSRSPCGSVDAGTAGADAAKRAQRRAKATRLALSRSPAPAVYSISSKACS